MSWGMSCFIVEEKYSVPTISRWKENNINHMKAKGVDYPEDSMKSELLNLWKE